MAIQPIPVGLQQANAVRGPAALSLNPELGDKIWIEYSLEWQDPSSDVVLPQQLASLVEDAAAYQKQHFARVKPTNYRFGDLMFGAYNPIFANDAQDGQDIFGSYGQVSLQRLKAIRQKFDPTAFFTRRTKGFHIAS